MTSPRFSDEELAQYRQDGFVVVRQMFDDEAMRILIDFARNDAVMLEGAYERRDASGQGTKLALWNHAGDDLYGRFARLPIIVDRMEQLLGGEVYHWHTKMMLKEPLVGGAWEWHQDYGYWYNNGCLYPLLASCLTAVDRASEANGCLQVLRGSHHIGRIEHGKTGDQVGADGERVEEAIKRHELVYVECSPGDSIFFHGNLLHCSSQNTSADPRWSLICCYNAARNSPYKETRHPSYAPLEKSASTAIQDWAREQAEAE